MYKYWTQNLNLSFSLAHQIHSQEKSTIDMLLQKNPTLEDINLLAANISFVLDKANKYEQKVISLPLNIPGFKLFSMQDTFDKDAKKYSVDSLESRYVNGRGESVYTSKNQQNSPADDYGVSNVSYNTLNHHTEQAVCEFLIQTTNIENIVQRLKTQILPNTKVLSVIIDIYSMRYVCDKCEIALLAMTHHDYLFIERLSDELDKHDIYISDNFAVIPRVSATQPAHNQLDMLLAYNTLNVQINCMKAFLPLEFYRTELMGKAWDDLIRLQKVDNNKPIHQELDERQINGKILQTDVRVYNMLETVESDFYNRTIFTSSHISQKKLMRDLMRDLEIMEYQKMIFPSLLNKFKRDFPHTSCDTKQDKNFNILESSVFHIDAQQTAEKIYQQYNPRVDKKKFNFDYLIKTNEEKKDEYDTISHIKKQLNLCGLDQELTSSLNKKIFLELEQCTTSKLKLFINLVNNLNNNQDIIDGLIKQNIKLVEVMQIYEADNRNCIKFLTLIDQENAYYLLNKDNVQLYYEMFTRVLEVDRELWINENDPLSACSYLRDNDLENFEKIASISDTNYSNKSLHYGDQGYETDGTNAESQALWEAFEYANSETSDSSNDELSVSSLGDNNSNYWSD